MTTAKGKSHREGVVNGGDFSFDALIELNRIKVDFSKMYASEVEGDSQWLFDFQAMPEGGVDQKGGLA